MMDTASCQNDSDEDVIVDDDDTVKLTSKINYGKIQRRQDEQNVGSSRWGGRYSRSNNNNYFLETKTLVTCLVVYCKIFSIMMKSNLIICIKVMLTEIFKAFKAFLSTEIPI